MDTISRQVYFESLKTVPQSSRGATRQGGNSYTGQRAYNVHRDLQRECREMQRLYDRRWRIAAAEFDRRIAVYENKLHVLRRRHRFHEDKVDSLPTIGEGHGHVQHVSRSAVTSHHRRGDVIRLPHIGKQFHRYFSEETEQQATHRPTGADIKQRKVIFLTADMLQQKLHGPKIEVENEDDWWLSAWTVIRAIDVHSQLII